MNDGYETAENRTLFKTGNPGGPGRPKGSPDKKWASLDYWFQLVESEWSEIKPETRVKVAIEAWKALLARKQVATPEDSVNNTEATMKMLKMLQDMSNGNNTRVGASSDSFSMDNGRPAPQIEGPAASSIRPVL